MKLLLSLTLRRDLQEFHEMPCLQAVLVADGIVPAKRLQFQGGFYEASFIVGTVASALQCRATPRLQAREAWRGADSGLVPTVQLACVLLRTCHPLTAHLPAVLLGEGEEEPDDGLGLLLLPELAGAALLFDELPWYP